MPRTRKSIRIVEAKTGDPALKAVEHMFHEMYTEMSAHGLSVPLAERGEKIWRESIEPVLGKNGALFLAETGGELIGFAHGSLRPSPAYLHAPKTGLVTHLFVSPAHRRSNVGRALVSGLEQWFRAKGVRAIELHAVMGNGPAQDFWRGLGYTDDLIQMRKAL